MADARPLYLNGGTVTRYGSADAIQIETIKSIDGPGTNTVALFTDLGSGDTIQIGGASSLAQIQGDLQVDGDETVVGDTVLSGDTQIGDAASDTLDVQADIISDLNFDGTDQAVTNDSTGTLGLLKSGTSGDVTVGNSATAGNVVLTSTNGVVQVASGALDINTSIDADVTTADVLASGAISLDAGAASNFTTTVGALTLDGAGGVNIAGNAAEIDLTTTGAIDINGNGVTIDGSTDVNIGSNAIWTDGSQVAINNNTGTGDWVMSVDGIDGTNDTETILLSGFNGETAGIHVYNGDPTNNVTPQGIGDICLNTSGGTVYFANNTTSADWVAVGSATGNSLQQAYDVGTSIQLSDAKGDMTIDTDDTVTVANFIVQNEAQTAQYLATDATNAQLELGHANITVGMIGKIDTDVTFETSGGAKTITGDGTNGLTVTAGASTALTLTSPVAATWSTTAGILTLDGAGGVAVQGNAGEIDLTTTGVVDINGTGGVTIDSVSTDIALTTTTAGDLDFNSANDILADATAGISLDAGAASNFTTSGGALTLDGATGVNIAGNASEIDLTTTGVVDINGTGGVTIDSTSTDIALTTTTAGDLDFNSANDVLVDAAAGISLDAGATSNFSTSAGDIDISAAAALDLDAVAGNVTVDAAATYDIALTVADNAASDITFDAHGAAAPIPINSATDPDLDTTAQNIVGAINELYAASSDVAISVTTGEAYSVGDAIYLSTADGKAYKTDADAAASSVFVGIAQDASTGIDETHTVIVNGEVTSSTDFAAMANGDVLYLDTTTAGGLTTTPPSAEGDTVLKVGIVSDQANDKFVIQVGVPFLL